ncbi:THAP domain-containing 4-like isoform X2 [Labeo rohita]|uniref:THAP domain-containing 4-like isoform X2 n=1 Tax=Labeo rohita TaxID=84645 RepID=A0A498LAC6_LABRO|nr:THAP domain-containing 4-like isoform X2 [Labeo rohita]
MRQLWLVAIGYSAGAKISSIKDFRVCSAHFSEDDYIPNQGGKSKKRILKSSAVPVPWLSGKAFRAENTDTTQTASAAVDPAVGKPYNNVKNKLKARLRNGEEI